MKGIKTNNPNKIEQKFSKFLYFNHNLALMKLTRKHRKQIKDLSESVYRADLDKKLDEEEAQSMK